MKYLPLTGTECVIRSLEKFGGELLKCSCKAVYSTVYKKEWAGTYIELYMCHACQQQLRKSTDGNLTRIEYIRESKVHTTEYEIQEEEDR